MDALDISLILSILSCGLVGGFIFTYAIVVMRQAYQTLIIETF